MNISHHRLVVGPPLHYYYYPGEVNNLIPSQFPYFQQFENYYRPPMDSPEEFMFPPSPNSIQSDSDNSLSSVEISPRPIEVKKPVPKLQEKIESRCCWKNCGIAFQSLDELAAHVSKVHAVGGPGGLFYCGWEGCTRDNKGFNARYKMLVHVRTHTNEKPHKCNICEKSFSRAENLKIHLRSHSGEKPYVCTVPGCNKAYSNSSDRFKHTRTHQVDKPYQCKVPGCPKRYTDPSSLRKHVKTYKHFVNEKQQTAAVPVEVQKAEERLSPKSIEADENELHPSKCSRDMCYNINQTKDFLSLDNILNLKKEEKVIKWNRTCFFPSPYEDPRNHAMDIDLPLDLSIHRQRV